MALPLLRRHPHPRVVQVTLPSLEEGSHAPQRCPVCEAPAIPRPNPIGQSSYTCGAAYEATSSVPCRSASGPLLAALLLARCRAEGFDRSAATLRRVAGPLPRGCELVQDPHRRGILHAIEDLSGAMDPAVLARVKEQVQILVWS